MSDLRATKAVYRQIEQLIDPLGELPVPQLLNGFAEAFSEQLAHHGAQASGHAVVVERRSRWSTLAGEGEEAAEQAESLGDLVHEHRLNDYFIGSAGASTPFNRGAHDLVGDCAGLVLQAPEAAFVLFFPLAGLGDKTALQVALGASHSILASKVLLASFRHNASQVAEIQNELLPAEAPSVDGWDLAVRWDPAESVGGDIVDFEVIESRSVNVAIGDATGHGLPAALHVRDVLTSLRVMAGLGYRAEFILKRLAMVMHQSAVASRFVSLMLCEFSPLGAVAVHSMGHEPPIVRRGGKCFALPGGGDVIGIHQHPEIGLKAISLEAGDVIVLYTDGITEACDPSGEMLGVDAVCEVVAASEGLPSSELADRIVERMQAHVADRRLSDDWTLVVATRTAIEDEDG